MTERPYTVLSCAISLDGCLDSAGPSRLVLSGEADLDRVDAERAAADAILVGAGTIRRDDPRLLIRSAQRRADRLARGLPEHPAGVAVTVSGDLDPGARFFTRDGNGAPAAGDGRAVTGGREARTVPASREAGAGAAAERLVYAATPAVRALRARLHGLAEIADAGDPPRLEIVLATLAGRGVSRLLVEGGARLGAEFLAGGLVDELHLVIAPFFVGDPAAPRFAGPGRYPPDRLTLAEVRPVGEVVLLRYLCAGAPGRAAPAGGEAGVSAVAGVSGVSGVAGD